METHTLTLGGRTFEAPRLPLKDVIVAYPLCRKLSNDGLIERSIAVGGALEATTEEITELAELAFIACRAADPTLTRDAFDALPISPPELLDAFFVVRYLTGAWRPTSAESPPPGEAEGVGTPLQSTSTASSAS